ncbi:hypothetical protein PQX77_007909 [Marasmius sp. AFHP31]|nr:hypothetical protein PQX77_007909 [Marasmius sp. AFHP31]
MASRKTAASQKAACTGTGPANEAPASQVQEPRRNLRRGRTDEEPIDDLPPVNAATKSRVTKSKTCGQALESTAEEPARLPAEGRNCIMPKTTKGSKQPPPDSVEEVSHPRPKPCGKASQTKATAKDIAADRDKGKGVDKRPIELPEVVDMASSNEEDPFASDSLSELERELNTPFKIWTTPLAQQPNTPGADFLTYDEGDYEYVDNDAPGPNQLVIASTAVRSEDGCITATPLR